MTATKNPDKSGLVVVCRSVMVPEAGLEPAHPKVKDFKSFASTDFAIRATNLLVLLSFGTKMGIL